MKIVPLGIPDDSKGNPVDVLKIEGESTKWNVVILCEGKSHTLSFNGGQLEKVHDHDEKCIEAHEIHADLAGGDLDSICQCVKVKLWHREFGITLIEDIMP